MSRIEPMANYIGGVVLALGVLCIGLSMPKPGWEALSDRLPEWLASFENGVLAAVIGAAIIAAGKALDGRSSKTRAGRLQARDVSAPEELRVWCMDYPGKLDVFAAYDGADESPEGRKKRIQTSGMNGTGRQLDSADFPLVLHAMDNPPDELTDYCYISGRIPMVSPRLQEVLKTLDFGNGAFFEAQFYTEHGAERLPWSHGFWNIGNKKDSFLPEESEVQRVTTTRTDIPFPEIYATRGSVQDGDIVVGPGALDGPDVWIESKLNGKIFFSDRFARVMREHGMLHLFDLKAVRVVQAE